MVEARQGVGKRTQLRQEFARLLARQGQAEQVMKLAGEDDDGNARREADRHRIGDEFDVGSHAQQPDRHQHQAGNAGRYQKPLDSVLRHRCGDKHDERPGRASDLEAAAAKQRNDEPANDGRVQAPVRGRPRCDSDRHRQWQRDDCNGQPGNGIRLEVSEPIPLAQDGDQFGGVELGEGRRPARPSGGGGQVHSHAPRPRSYCLAHDGCGCPPVPLSVHAGGRLAPST